MIAATERVLLSEALVDELKDQSQDLFTRKSELVRARDPSTLFFVHSFRKIFDITIRYAKYMQSPRQLHPL
jgi:hypothetical protein